MKYCIGLDIGIASVGFAVLALDQDENPWGIIKAGSRVFDVAENPKNGASLALPRREARSSRRRLRRHRHRLERIKALLVSSGIITENELNNLYNGELADIYTLRVCALDNPVTNLELARILLHLAQRRGFKSNRKAESSDKKNGELLTAVNENKKRMAEKRYRTIGEMFLKDPAFAQYKRNKGGNYIATVHRDDIAAEARLILAKQAELGNSKISEAFVNKYMEILLSQRQYDEGPGEGSPYAGDQILKMVGRCTFEPAEYRAAKACYSFEYFNLLQKVNHLRLLADGKTIALDELQRKKILNLAYNRADLKYSQIRKELGLGDQVMFNTVPGDDYLAVEKKTKFNFLPVYHEIRKALAHLESGGIEKFPVELLDNIGNVLSLFKGDEKRRQELQALNLKAEEIEALLPIKPAKFCHLSLKTLRKINPFLEQGMIYNEACAAAGYEFRGHSNQVKSFLLPAHTEEMENITSPVVRRAIAQCIKVINAIIREQKKSPIYINIELAREMAKNFDERNQINKAYEENRASNERIMERLRTEFHRQNPTGMDLVKFKLWQEQDGISPYSRKALNINRLFETGYVDVDHIIPYSISFDDSFRNKVLVLSSENRDKGNRLPLTYLKEKYGQESADEYRVWVQNNVRDYRKRQKLLKTEITDEDINRFKERSLQDTKTASRFMSNFIRDHLQFAPSDTGRKKRVTAVNGAITSYLRKRWGINKVRADGDKHHALDAIVIACATDKLIKDLSSFSSYSETRYSGGYKYFHSENDSGLVNIATGEIVKRFPYPWLDFRKEVMARLSDNPAAALSKLNLDSYATTDLSAIKPIFVSRMPRRKVTGAAHKETVRSARCVDAGIVISKVDLTKLKLDPKTGEIANYYNPESDMLLYEALKERLCKFGNNGKKAFAEPFYKPKADGTQGPLVKKVKVYDKSTLNVWVQGKTAVADNDSMVRVDVFKIAGDGYYLVPVYTADTLKDELPNKAILAHKKYEEWPEMRSEDFIFSLYPNDLIKFEHKSSIKFKKVNKESTLPETLDIKEGIAYYKGADISTGCISIITHDNSYFVHGLGVKTLISLEKYQVDVLGNYTKVKKEHRQPFRRGE